MGHTLNTTNGGPGYGTERVIHNRGENVEPLSKIGNHKSRAHFVFFLHLFVSTNRVQSLAIIADVLRGKLVDGIYHFT